MDLYWKKKAKSTRKWGNQYKTGTTAFTLGEKEKRKLIKVCNQPNIRSEIHIYDGK